VCKNRPEDAKNAKEEMMMWKLGIAAALNLQALCGAVMGYEAMYPRTPSGAVEVKELPERKALYTQSTEDYFNGDNGLFIKLFRYIEKHDVAMTVPVESDVNTSRMRFFAGGDAKTKALPDEGGVVVEAMPAQRVLSAGLRGGYTRETFTEGLGMIDAWLARNPDWMKVGEPYAVYWHGPFVPAFLKRSEVHVPIAKTIAGGTPAGEQARKEVAP
jgi:hypothetical protein